MANRAAIDIGGTFTDVVVQDEGGRLHVGKYLTTPDPSVNALHGLRDTVRKMGIGLGDLTQVLHGTTVASNTVIQRTVTSGVGLIVTKGFGDYLQIGRQKKPDLFNLELRKSNPLLPRNVIFEVTERMDYDGSTVVPLNEDEVRQVARELVSRGIKSVGVCFLHSFTNPEHERRAGRIIQEEAPEAMISLSCDVCPVWREYERMNTVAANAYILMVVKDYLERMAKELRDGGYKGLLYMLQSNGGLAVGEGLLKRPIWLLESGPAGGVMAAIFFGKLSGYGNLLAFDMGGTTAKGCTVVDYKPNTRSEIEVDRHAMKPASGLSLSIPSIDMIEVGAGGGSIAEPRVGIITVGPRSAGANPGPICYRLGGTEVTVTDANLLLGYLSADYFLGGEMKLDREAAIKGLEEKIAKPLGIGITEAAWGIHNTVNTNMELALRVVSLQRGFDPADFTFIATGGAGPAHGARLAKALGMPRILFPPAAGVASAVGLLASEARFDLGRTWVTVFDGNLRSEVVDTINGIYDEMEAEGTKLLQECKAGTDFTMTRSADMRYRMQGYDVPVMLPSRRLTVADGPMLKDLFEESYFKMYGYTNPDVPFEGVTWRVSCGAGMPEVKIEKLKKTVASVAEAIKGRRKVYFPEYNGYEDCRVYDRYLLFPGATIEGPAIVEERESTAVILPGDVGQVDDWGNILVTLTKK
ncbi:MAG: hydantoinase/oxoprolinase family protein [Dehalococcoidales bacterium]